MKGEQERDIKFFIDNYQAKVCACGGPKDARLSFCRDCYFSLPEELREDLSGPLNDEEYQWAWNKSYEFLLQEGRIEGKGEKGSSLFD